MTRGTLRRSFGTLLFGLMLVLGLFAPQAASANNSPPNPALNPAVIPQQPIQLACSPSGGQIAGVDVQAETDLQGHPVFRFEIFTQKNTKASVVYRKHGSNGLWASAYVHFSPDFTTDHVFYTYALAASTEYDFTLTTYQCGNVVDTQMLEYWT